VTGQVAYNGKAVWGRWRNCDHEATAVTNKVTWCDYWNNGGKAPEKFMDLGANGHVGASSDITISGRKVPAEISAQLKRDNTYWMRIDVYRNGKARLRGGTNRD
jgi:hypothetical protein